MSLHYVDQAADACEVPATSDLVYADEALVAILRQARTIAMVGASPNWNRPSYFAMKYMQRKGYRVIPVNPVAAGQVILGEVAVADLAAIDVPVDIVDIFRKPAAVPEIVEEAIRIGARVVWMQLSVRHAEAAARAEAAGLTVIQDRCVKIEFGRLSGELSWNGINSDLITSRRRKLIA